MLNISLNSMNRHRNNTGSVGRNMIARVMSHSQVFPKVTAISPQDWGGKVERRKNCFLYFTTIRKRAGQECPGVCLRPSDNTGVGAALSAIGACDHKLQTHRWGRAYREALPVNRETGT